MRKDRVDSKIYRLLRSDDKGIEEATGILSCLVRIIMIDRDINGMRYSALMRKWLAKNANHVTDLLSERENMNKDIYKPNMTWNSFLKVLSFFRVKGFRITVQLKWHNDDASEHYLDVPNIEDFISRRKRTKSNTVEQPGEDEK